MDCSQGEHEVALVVTETPPQILDAAAAAAVDRGEAMIGQEIALTWQGGQGTLDRTDLLRALTIQTHRTVRHASCGEEALKLLEQTSAVALLFTDVVMPGMSGRQLADVARLNQPYLKVLYTTGYTQNAIVHNGVLDQDAELISKPFTVDQLARKVRKVLAV